jgi:hypothetical protein
MFEAKIRSFEVFLIIAYWSYGPLESLLPHSMWRFGILSACKRCQLQAYIYAYRCYFDGSAVLFSAPESASKGDSVAAFDGDWHAACLSCPSSLSTPEQHFRIISLYTHSSVSKRRFWRAQITSTFTQNFLFRGDAQRVPVAGDWKC